MSKKLWRDVIAPRLTNRLAARVASLLVGDPAFAAQISRSLPYEPRQSDATAESLQSYPGYEGGDLHLFERFRKQNLTPADGFITDFLGCRTRLSSIHDVHAGLGNHVLGFPIPSDYHAETVEWLGLLKTAITAQERYVAMEWGAGWAPWLVAGAKAAQHLGIDEWMLYGVEADPAHFKSMRQHFEDNGLLSGKHVLLQAAVGTEAGQAKWPDDPDPRNSWGTRPVRDNSSADVDYLDKRVDRFSDVQILSARDLILREPQWDMVHIDIQGWEASVCRGCATELNERVKWVIIGVHSRIQEAELLQLFHQNGWVLEHEKPTKFRFDPSRGTFESMVIHDGTHVWRNPKLAPGLV
jgi:FkbM family methyltransferase